MTARSISDAWRQYSSMINGIMLVVGFAATLIFIGSYKTDIEKSIAENKRSIEENDKKEDERWDEHLQMHKDRLGEVKERDGVVSTRLSSIESDIRKIDNLNYRITVLEQNRDSLTKAVTDMQVTIQQIASDQRVSAEILKRLDSAINQRQGR